VKLVAAKHDTTKNCSFRYWSSSILASFCCCWVLHIFFMCPNWPHLKHHASSLH
jgi:hypothetical protein